MFQKVAVGTVVVIILGVIIAFIVTRDTTQVNCPTNAETVQDETNVTTNPEQDILKFFHVSDIHFDPLYDKSIADTATLCRPKHINGTNGTGVTSSYEAPYGRIGCDTPLTLLESTLNAMKQNSEGSRFVLISGDLSAHKLSDRSKGSPKILQGIALVSNKAHQTFPDIPVFPVFGNNDLPENYKVPESNDWYKKVLANWAPLILCSNCTQGAVKPTTRTLLEETFLDGGYYNASIADGKMVLLALNTMYWHINANYSNPVVSTTAVRQMMWLRDQLDMAKTQGKKVFIMGHIHPGGDPFCPKDCYKYNFRFLWKANETKAFVNLVAVEYHDIVAGQFYSHVHKDDFNLQVVDSRKNGSSKSPAKSFALFVPSISVVYKNNPAFRVLSMDSQQLSLIDYNQYFLDLVTATEFSKPVWQFDYTFSKKYPSNNTFLNADRIYELNQQLINPHSNKYWQEYIFSRQVHYRPDDYSRFALYCIMRHVFEEDFKNCRDKYTVPGG